MPWREGTPAGGWPGSVSEAGLIEGRMCWFPSPELTALYGNGGAAFDNGIWLLPAVGMQLLGLDEQVSFCLFMGLIGLGTMAAAWWMMKAFSEKAAVVLSGTLLYMSCPYHIYICYDRADIGQALALALVPVFIGGMVRLYESRSRSLAVWCISALAYGGLWYADARWGVIVGACMALYLLLWKRWLPGLLPLVVGGALAMPVVIYLARYLVKGGMQVWELPMGSVMGNGYTLSSLMTIWTYRPDQPGIGAGLMGGLLLLAWLYWNGQPGKMTHSIKGILLTAGVLAAAALKVFPWDYVQRLGLPFCALWVYSRPPGYSGAVLIFSW